MPIVLRPGDTFRSKWFEGLVTVSEIKGNDLIVSIDPEKEGMSKWTEIWNYEHTIWGFHGGDYLKIK